MPQRAIRFCVTDGLLRAASWKVWSPAGKEDVYVTCRERQGAFRVVLHESGACRIEYDGRVFNVALVPAAGEPGAAPRTPVEGEAGVVPALRIVTTRSAVSSALGSETRAVRIPAPAAGEAAEVRVYIGDAQGAPSELPGKGAQVIGSYRLPSGRTVWATASRVPEPRLAQLPEPIRLTGISPPGERPGGRNQRRLVLGDGGDVRRAIYDCGAAFTPEVD